MTKLIGILDTEHAHIYWCESPEQAGLIKQMLDLFGKSYRELTYK